MCIITGAAGKEALNYCIGEFGTLLERDATTEKLSTSVQLGVDKRMDLLDTKLDRVLQ